MPDLQQQFDRLTEDVDAGRFVDPASIRRRGDRRTRRQLAGGAAALAVVVTAGVIVTVNATGGDSDVKPIGTPDPSVSESPTPEPSATATATYIPPKSTDPAPQSFQGPATVAVGPALIPVPDGWHAVDVTYDHACVEPTERRPSGLGCGGFEVTYGWTGELPGREWSTFTRETPGWSQATGVNTCPDGQPGTDQHWLTSNQQNPTIDGELRPVGDRQAYYYEWSAGCADNDFTFTPRAWYLPTSRLLFVDGFGYDDVAPILAGVTWDDGTWTTAFLRDADYIGGGRQLDLDEFDWSSKDPNAFNDDTQILRNPEPTVVKVDVDPDAKIVGYAALTGDVGRGQLIPFDSLAEFVNSGAGAETPFLVHRAADGTVDQVVEITGWMTEIRD
jgi:hypothetical protein